MSDDELSDDMKELDELIAEYRSKDIEEEQVKDNSSEQSSSTENEEQSDPKDLSDGLINLTEVPMDKVLFGDKTKLLKNLENAVNKSVKHENELKEEKDKDIDGHTTKAKKRKTVWDDVDDEEIQLGEVKKETRRTGPLNHLKMDKSYKEYLTAKFARIVNQPKWASLDETKDKASDDEEDQALLRTVGFLSKPSASILSPDQLQLKRLKDLNRATYAEGHINTIQFHPTSAAALIAGDKGVATIYAVDGTQNDKLHNIHIPNFPIRCAKILPCGTKAIFGSITRFAYIYDLMNAKETCYRLRRDNGNLSNFQVSPCGRYLIAAGLSGEIHIYEAKTFELIRTLKQNDDVSAMCFTADSKRIIVSGRSSSVCIFSIRQQKLEHKFIDDGCIMGAAMDLSPNQRLLATGSREGVVNVYNFDSVMFSNAPQPEKTFLNLTTGISCVRFNHSSELLAFSSFLCQDAVRIAHFPSGTVYANFPGHMPKLGNVRALQFSPNSAYFAIGTKKACPLFRFKHFQNY